MCNKCSLVLLSNITCMGNGSTGVIPGTIYITIYKGNIPVLTRCHKGKVYLLSWGRCNKEQNGKLSQGQLSFSLGRGHFH